VIKRHGPFFTENLLRSTHTGTINRDINASERIHSLFYPCLDTFLAGYIRIGKDDIIAKLLRQRLGSVRLNVKNGNPSTATR
jgi:hypothetical protein